MLQKARLIIPIARETKLSSCLKSHVLNFVGWLTGSGETRAGAQTTYPEKNKAGEFFHNLKEKLSFPVPNLLCKLNKNIILPGGYPWRLGSRIIKHEFLNILKRTCLHKKEALSFLLSVTREGLHRFELK